MEMDSLPQVVQEIQMLNGIHYHKYQIVPNFLVTELNQMMLYKVV